MFRHDDFPNMNLHCVERYANVETEGVAADYFDPAEDADGADAPPQDDRDLPVLPNNNLAENVLHTAWDLFLCFFPDHNVSCSSFSGKMKYLHFLIFRRIPFRLCST